MTSKKKVIVGIELRGLNENTWKNLSNKLFEAIDSLCSQISDNPITKEYAKDIAQIGLSFFKAKAQKPTLENEKLVAEIAVKYAEAKKLLMETEKIELEKMEVAIRNMENIIRVISLVKDLDTTFLLDEKGNGNLVIGNFKKD